jgi:FtsP/CotA-like multicopper oxidase with cupredoxin domain
VRAKALILALCIPVAACSPDDATIAPDQSSTNNQTTLDLPDMSEDQGTDAEVVLPVMPEFVGTPVLADTNDDPNIVEVNLMAGIQPVAVSDDLSLDMYAYNGSVPGPLLEATVGDTVIVHFTNTLDEPTTVHWHGLRISDDMDGNPRIQTPVAPGETFTYQFVVPDAGTFWYHPHVRTNEQIEKGLYGPLVVHEKAEERPLHNRERVFVLDDILIDGDKIAAPFGGHMEAMQGRYGNALLTNGLLGGVSGTAKAGERERWRLVNTANARTMEIRIEGAAFKVYGNDGGRVEPYMTPELIMPVGRRFDVEVVYDQPGRVTLQQIVVVQNANGNLVKQAFDVGVIDVGPADAEKEKTVVTWAPAPDREARAIDRNEVIILDAVEGGPMGIEWQINGEAHKMEPLYEFARGATVKMEIRNTLAPEHPFHLHGQFFEIEGLPGLWDTVLVPGETSVNITAFMDNPGNWMMHCHIAEHAELGMMSSFVVNE